MNPHESVRIERASDLERFFSQANQWDRLARGVPFRQVAWLKAWWDHFGQGQEPYLLVARDEADQVCGLLPFYRKASSPRTLGFVGDNNVCTDFVSVLAEPECAEAIASKMAEFLIHNAATQQDGWDLIWLDGVSDNDHVMKAFAQKLQRAGALLHAQSRMNTWNLKCDESWDEMLRCFTKSRRRKLRTLAAQVEKTPGLENDVASTKEQVAEFLETFIDLHQLRWNAVGEPGTYAEKPFRDFIAQACDAMFQQGQLNLRVLKHHGRIIGGEINFLGQDRQVYSYSTAYDLDEKAIQPGHLLLVETLKYAYQQQLVGLDFLRGDEPYKAKNGAVATRLLELRIVAPLWWAKACHSAWTAKFEFKQWARRRTGRKEVQVVDRALRNDE